MPVRFYRRLWARRTRVFYSGWEGFRSCGGEGRRRMMEGSYLLKPIPKSMPSSSVAVLGWPTVLRSVATKSRTSTTDTRATPCGLQPPSMTMFFEQTGSDSR